jgi:hypothetical protein
MATTAPRTSRKPIRRPSEKRTSDVRSDDVGLFYTALMLWGDFFGAQPPAGCDERRWARLEALSFFLSSAVIDRDARADLRDRILRAVEESLTLLDGLDLPTARRRLERISRITRRP